MARINQGQSLATSGGTLIVVGSYTPSDNQTNPSNLVGTEDFNMVWSPAGTASPNTWSRWGHYGVDNDATPGRVPGVAIFGRPELNFGETPQQAGVVTAIGNNADSFHALRVVASDLYRAGSAKVDYRQSDSEVDANTVDVSGLVTPVVVNALGTLDRLRGANADNMAATGIPASGMMVFDGVTWDRVRAGTTAGSILVNNPTAANLLVTATLDAATLAALETIELGASTLAALESITVQNGAGAAAVNIQDGGNSITVDAVDLDIRNLVFATDKVDVSGSAVTADTELAAASALTDADPNPTTSRIGSNLLLFNGITWDRARSAPGVTGTTSVGGPTASDGVLAVAPVTVGARASTAVPAAVSADGDVVNLWATRQGRLRTYNSGRNRLGVYHGNMGNTTFTLAADGALAGRFWLVNTSATVVSAIRKIYFTSVSTTALVTLTSPNFNVERITFTGTPSGGTVTPAKRDSNDAAHTTTIRTAATGMTITAGAVAHAFQSHTVLTAIGETRPVDQLWPEGGDEEEWIVLRQNQGIVIRQATAGSAGDTRSARFDIIWEEFTE